MFEPSFFGETDGDFGLAFSSAEEVRELMSFSRAQSSYKNETKYFHPKHEYREDKSFDYMDAFGDEESEW